MKTPNFAPGLRLSSLDILVLIVGAIGTIALWTMTWWWGFVIGFVLVHFFLFCNVFRVTRTLELIWAGIFTVLSASTMAMDAPGWPITASVAICTTLGIIIVEIRKPSYHGIFWRKINPQLPVWWELHANDSRNVNLSDTSETP